MLNTIKELSLVGGVSGDEALIRKAIIDKIGTKCSYEVDNLGNLICFKKGKKTPSKKLMISAHMDEVGFIATNVTEDGLIKFTGVGGIDPRVVLGRAVKFYENNIYGVIGTKAIHHQTEQERATAVKMDQMFIDIGANSKEQALEHIALGDMICFADDYCELGKDLIKCKALDDRAGCALMIEMINDTIEYDTFFAFTTQEEVGLRGGMVAAYTVNPDYAIVLESTTAADIAGVSAEKKVCELSKGVVVGFMDGRTIYDKELYNLAHNLAKENGILSQTKTMVAGGNESGAIQTARGGVITIAVNLPCRYLHSGGCVINKNDVESTYKLLRLLSTKILED